MVSEVNVMCACGERDMFYMGTEDGRRDGNDNIATVYHTFMCRECKGTTVIEEPVRNWWVVVHNMEEL